MKPSGNSGKRRSSNSKSSASNSKNKSNPSPSLEMNGISDERSGTPKDNSSNSKFTTSNFVETIVTQSESVFGNELPISGVPASATSGKPSAKGNPGKNSVSAVKSNYASRKRKTGARTPTVNENSNQSVSSEASGSAVVSAQSTIDGGEAQLAAPDVTSMSDEKRKVTTNFLLFNANRYRLR